MRIAGLIVFCAGLGVAACGSAGPISAHKTHVERTAGGNGPYVPMPTAAPAGNWSDVNDRARADQAAGQSGHCTLGSSLCR